jgi:hypothetical protein
MLSEKFRYNYFAKFCKINVNFVSISSQSGFIWAKGKSTGNQAENFIFVCYKKSPNNVHSVLCGIVEEKIRKISHSKFAKQGGTPRIFFHKKK